MKLTKTRLKEIIKEVIQEEKLNEVDFSKIKLPSAVDRFLNKFVDAMKGSSIFKNAIPSFVSDFNNSIFSLYTPSILWKLIKWDSEIFVMTPKSGFAISDKYLISPLLFVPISAIKISSVLDIENVDMGIPIVLL